MSKKAETAPREMTGDTRGIREIPDTLRRGARMSPAQRRWSLTAATVLILALVMLIIVSAGRSVSILKVNESALVNGVRHIIVELLDYHLFFIGTEDVR